MSFGAVVGENVKRLREERVLTQHELANRWRGEGLRWARSKIAALENGHRDQVSAGVLILMAKGLDVPVNELLSGDGLIGLEPAEVHLSREEARALLAGVPPSVAAVACVPQREADAALAKLLGLPVDVIVRAAEEIFGGLTLTAERDRRVDGMGTLTVTERGAHRGHITRELAREIQQHLAALEEMRSR